MNKRKLINKFEQIMIDRQIDVNQLRQIDRQIDRYEAIRQIDGQIDREIDRYETIRQIDRQIDIKQ